jgi:hypothetical protein
MLNQLIFHSSVGFGWSVRATAFIILALLIVANALMRDRPEVTRTSLPRPSPGELVRDTPYVIAIISYVRSFQVVIVRHTMTVDVIPDRSFFIGACSCHVSSSL